MSRRVMLPLIILAAGLLASPALGQRYSEYGNILTLIKVRGIPITAEVVSTPEKLYLGLSHRRELPEGRGMLFIMEKPGRYAFCMRDMHLALDIIWIADNKVAHIHQNLSPSDQGVFLPPVPVSLVLEVPGGFVERHAIQVGDPLEVQLSALEK